MPDYKRHHDQYQKCDFAGHYTSTCTKDQSLPPLPLFTHTLGETRNEAFYVLHPSLSHKSSPSCNRSIM